MQKWKLILCVLVYSSSALFGFNLCLRVSCILQLPCHGMCVLCIYPNVCMYVCISRVILFMSLIVATIILYNSNIYIIYLPRKRNSVGDATRATKNTNQWRSWRSCCLFATHLELDCSVLYLFSCGGCYDNFCLTDHLSVRSSSSKYTSM